MTRPALPSAFLRGHIAHRGLHSDGVPENSIAAFRAAANLGVGIELDIQPSSDGVAMVFHDYDLERLTGGTGPVGEQTADALRAMPLLGTPHPIPRLRDVLTMVAGRVPLLIEIKDRDGDMGPAVGPLEDAVMADLESYAGDAAVMSFNPQSVACFRDRAPDLPRGLVTAKFAVDHWSHLSDATRRYLHDIPDYDTLGCSFISHQADALDMPRVAELKAQGAKVLCWTIRSRAQEVEARRVADAVTFEGYLP